MKLVRQFARLTSRDRWLLLRAAVLVSAVRLALWTLPFNAVRRILGARRTVSQSLSVIPVKRLAWAVQASARRIPGASCLTQALALQYLLARTGKAAELSIGIAKSPTQTLESHAWVEYGGEVLVGDNGELERYSPIVALGSGKL